MNRFEYRRSSAIRSSNRIHHWLIFFLYSSLIFFYEAMRSSRNCIPAWTSSKQFYSTKLGFVFLQASISIWAEVSPRNVFEMIITRFAFHCFPLPRFEAMYFAIYVVLPWPEFAIHRALTGGYLSAFFIIFVIPKKNDWIHSNTYPCF